MKTIFGCFFFALLILFTSGSGINSSSELSLTNGQENIPLFQLKLDPSQPGPVIPDDFIGFSYEKTLLTRPGVFTTDNIVLKRLLINLGKGNLRIGANGADIAGWSRLSRSDSTGKNVVTSDDLDRFYGFIKETGWNVVHALNLRTSRPEIGADEAEYVASISRDRLVAFEIGNEPDLKMRNRYRVTDYIREFREFTSAIKAKVPDAKFVGPGATYFCGQYFWSLFRGIDEWTIPFSNEAGKEIVQLTHHIYVLGTPGETQPEEQYEATISNMLGTAAQERYIPTLKKLAMASERIGVPYRINETNSCYHVGIDGVSNVFASALWTVDYLFTLATFGASGVNFHGGTQYFAPIETSASDLSRARPMYYGMLMFHTCSRGSLIPVNVISGPQLEVSAYATLSTEGSVAVAIINREAITDIEIELDATRFFTTAKVLRLEGPSLSAKTGITFGGASVTQDGEWTSASVETIVRQDRLFKVRIPAMSAVALMLEKDPVDPSASKRPKR